MNTKTNQKTLIITRDNKAFKAGRSLLLLGKWCDTDYLAESNNSDIDYVDHPLSNHDEREKHYHYIQKTSNQLLIEIVNTLNAHHQITFSNKIWKMLLGNYMLTLSHIVYVKWLLLQNAVKIDNIEAVRIPVFDNQDTFIPKDLKGYFNFFQYETFLAYLTKNILLKINPDIKKEEFHLDLKEINVKKKSLKQSFKFYLFDVLGKYFLKFNPNPKLFFYLTSMSKKSEIYINLKLGQIPFVHPFQNLKTCSLPNNKLRTKLKSNNYRGFEKILYELFWEFLPISLLERFSSNYNQVSKMTHYFNPSVVVTSMDGIMSSEPFIFYLASKEEKKPKVKVISLQHGGVYGTAKYNSVEEHEIDVSDYFFSWGWKKNKKVIPSYLHKHLGNSFKKEKKGSNLVFINYSWSMHDYRISPTIMSCDMEKYIDNQKIFIQNIEYHVKRKLRIRFYVEDYGWEIKKSIFKYIDNSNLSNSSYMKDLERAKIVVPTYNSTTILETLAFDIPTVAYFDPNAEKFNDNASKYFQILADVGILHYDPLSAANFINSIWNDVETWWNSADVKKAKKGFVNEFANLPTNSQKMFNRQLLEILK